MELLACGVWLITIKQENFLRYIEILLPIMSNLDGLFVTFQQQHCLFCPDTCSLDSCKNPSVTGFKNKYLVRQRDVCGSKLHAEIFNAVRRSQIL